MRILLAGLLAVSASTALAEPAPDVTKMSSDDCARARAQKKTCVLTIEDEAVDGKVPTAGDPTITIKPETTVGSLIRLRRDFIVEILKSAENI